MAEDKQKSIRWIEAFWRYSNNMPEENPDGEFPVGEELGKGEESGTISVGKPVQTCFAVPCI